MKVVKEEFCLRKMQIYKLLAPLSNNMSNRYHQSTVSNKKSSNKQAPKTQENIKDVSKNKQGHHNPKAEHIIKPMTINKLNNIRDTSLPLFQIIHRILSLLDFFIKVIPFLNLQSVNLQPNYGLIIS